MTCGCPIALHRIRPLFFVKVQQAVGLCLPLDNHVLALYFCLELSSLFQFLRPQPGIFTEYTYKPVVRSTSLNGASRWVPTGRGSAAFLRPATVISPLKFANCAMLHTQRSIEVLLRTLTNAEYNALQRRDLAFLL